LGSTPGQGAGGQAVTGTGGTEGGRSRWAVTVRAAEGGGEGGGARQRAEAEAGSCTWPLRAGAAPRQELYLLSRQQQGRDKDAGLAVVSRQ
jgi:hypothetical protein